MKLTCYAVHEFAPKIVPAQAQRPWMDDFRHAYRCLPMVIANSHGWEVLCPAPIEIFWNGGPRKEDVAVRALKPMPGDRSAAQICRSHFAQGIATFELGYIFRTDPEWDLLATGPFNSPKENIAPLTGIMESDWLPFPFTMNWQMLRPGRAVFEQDEPFCFIFPVRKQALIACKPEIRRVTDDADLNRQYELFNESRAVFMQRLERRDSEAIKQGWQRHYFRGTHPDGTTVDQHIQKLRLAKPVEVAGQASAQMPGECPGRSGQAEADSDTQ